MTTTRYGGVSYGRRRQRRLPVEIEGEEEDRDVREMRMLTLVAWMPAAVTEEAGVDGELARRSDGRS